MSDCQITRDRLVLYAEGELPAGDKKDVESHLASCAECRAEADGIDKVREWLADPELFAPSADLAWQLLPRRLSERVRTTQFKSWLPSNLGSLGWTVSMAATFLLACGLLWLAQQRTPEPAPVAMQVEAPGNQAFLGKIQSAYAREMTSQYLAQCQDLLLDVMRAEKSCSGEKYDVSLEVARARDLLRSKRMLDPELSAPEVASARELCDELEDFLLNLSTSEKCESPDRMRGMERFIQREQLLLRINVLQAEL